MTELSLFARTEPLFQEREYRLRLRHDSSPKFKFGGLDSTRMIIMASHPPRPAVTVALRLPGAAGCGSCVTVSDIGRVADLRPRSAG